MGHVSGQSRYQATLFAEVADDLVPADHPVRVIDGFVDRLDLAALGFSKVEAEATGRPPYAPADLLKLYVYGYLNRVRSSRKLEGETRRNLEVLWLINRVQPSYKTIADFRKDHAEAIVGVCRSCIQFCHGQALLGAELVAIDGTKIEAVASRKKVVTPKTLAEQAQAVERKIAEHLKAMCEAAQVTAVVPRPQTVNPKGKGLFDRDAFVYDAESDSYRCPAGQTLSVHRVSQSEQKKEYWNANACRGCPLKAQCTKAGKRSIVRSFHEEAREAMHQRAKSDPKWMTQRKSLVEHPIGTMKWMMGYPRFLLRGSLKAKAELALTVLGYNLKRLINILAVPQLLATLRLAPA
jgi:transposase